MRSKTTGGFTLIELLVVIAIIGILASMILVALGSARNKGKDARVISDLNQIRVQISSEASSTGTFSLAAASCLNAAGTGTGTSCSGFSADILANCPAAAGTPCTATPFTISGSTTAWAVSSYLNTGVVYCLDSTGKVGSAVAASQACP